MTKDQFIRITNTGSSWALWPEKEETVSNFREYFITNIDKLKPNIIFLGLNPSKGITDCVNFHVTKHKGDTLLKEYIQGCDKLKGGFMTDLYSITQSKSSKVKEDREKIELFINKLEQLKLKEVKIICFGNKVFDELSKQINRRDARMTVSKSHIEEINLIGYSVIISNTLVHIFRVWHYSNYGKYQMKLKELNEQLKYINNYELLNN